MLVTHDCLKLALVRDSPNIFPKYFLVIQALKSNIEFLVSVFKPSSTIVGSVISYFLDNFVELRIRRKAKVLSVQE